VIFLQNWTIVRKLSVATVLAVATGIFGLLMFQSAQVKTNLMALSERNNLTITELLVKQSSSAIRWKKTDIVTSTFAKIADADDSILTSYIVFDSEGNELVSYQSSKLPKYDLSGVLNKHRKALNNEKSVSYSVQDNLVDIVPAHAGKKNHRVGTVAIAWSSLRTKENIQDGLVSSVLAAVVVLLLLIAMLFWLLCHMFSTPMNRLITLARDLAEGEGDLRARLDVSGKDELAQLATWINLFIEKVQNVVVQFKGSTDSLKNAADQMAIITEQSNQSVLQQRSDIDQVASAIEEMSATVAEVARNTAQAADAATQASIGVGDTQKVVGQNLENINGLADEVGSATEVIEKLAHDTDSIGSILDVIRGIADQTNLLALNAAIEAARAGEQGRGFAVVADEVRTLASRTQESTQEIQRMIESVQSGSNNAVTVMKSGRDMANTSVDQSDAANQSLRSVSDIVENISQMNLQIAAAAEEQSHVTVDINKNIVNVHTLFEQSIEMSNSLAQSGVNVSDLANELTQIVSQFKT